MAKEAWSVKIWRTLLGVLGSISCKQPPTRFGPSVWNEEMKANINFSRRNLFLPSKTSPSPSPLFILLPNHAVLPSKTDFDDIIPGLHPYVHMLKACCFALIPNNKQSQNILIYYTRHHAMLDCSPHLKLQRLFRTPHQCLKTPPLLHSMPPISMGGSSALLVWICC